MTVLLDLSEPRFTRAEVLQVTGLKGVTLDQWVHRGHFVLQTPTAEGERWLFCAADILCLGAMLELSRIGLPPSRFTHEMAETIVQGAGLWHQQEYQRAWGDPENLGHLRNLDRWLVAFPSPATGELHAELTADPGAPGQVARIIFDTFAFAERVIGALETIAATRPVKRAGVA